jgi:hypothetical protein
LLIRRPSSFHSIPAVVLGRTGPSCALGAKRLCTLGNVAHALPAGTLISHSFDNDTIHSGLRLPRIIHFLHAINTQTQVRY